MQVVLLVQLDMQHVAGMKQSLWALLSAKRKLHVWVWTAGSLPDPRALAGARPVQHVVIVVLVLYNMSRGLKALSEP